MQWYMTITTRISRKLSSETSKVQVTKLKGFLKVISCAIVCVYFIANDTIPL